MKTIYENIERIKKEVKSHEREIKALKERLVKWENKRDSWESLKPIGTVRVVKRTFTYPFHYPGGANPDERTWGAEEVLFLTPEEWMEASKEEIGWGKGYTLTLA